MGNYYQIATTPKLYVSYPLWQYSSGALDSVNSNFNVPQEDLIRMITLDPSNTTELFPNPDFNVLSYRVVPSYDDFTDLLKSNLWNFDYVMLLGHNLSSAGSKIKVQANNDSANVIDLNTQNIVNHTPNGVPEYDGWSLLNLVDKPNSDSYRFRIGFEPENDTFNEVPLQLGSILWGKSFEFPQNTNLSTTTTFSYGIKQKTTISGKTISNANWTKPNNWITEPFGLGDERGDNYQRRSGVRSWKVSFDSLAPDKVMNQNMMMNSNGYTAQSDHSTGADGIESLYNINNGVDIFTSVINKTNASHLPMVMQIDKDDNSPSNFAIVRIKEGSYKITQKSPLLMNVSFTLQEQI
mgnify:CR=1 FL=1|tara:strand:+ start:19589 stop:20644 length:1056 start_codon:yes stop_codon:yes gene_type:complete